MIRLEKFNQQDYSNLIKWIDSEDVLVQIAGRQMSFPVTEEQWIFRRPTKTGMHLA